MKHKHRAKSILVIGLGRFGRHLATKLQELGNSVMVVDIKEQPETSIPSTFENIMIGDCTNENVLGALGVSNFDICFVTIGTNFEASVVITSLLKNFGAKHIVTKASRNIQRDVLKKMGADEIIDPERDMAEKVAVRYNMHHVFDYIELTVDYSIYEIIIPNEWIGKTIGEINIRRKYTINVLAVKDGENFYPLPGADYKFCDGNIMVLMGKDSDVERLTQL